MFKILCLIFIVFHIIEAKKHKPSSTQTTLEQATNKISTLLEDVQNFFQDVLNSFSEMFDGFTNSSPKPKKNKNKNKNNKKKKNSFWDFDVMKYGRKTLKSAYRVIENVIPVIDTAKETMDDIGETLPDVPLSEFIEDVMHQIVPDLFSSSRDNCGKT